MRIVCPLSFGLRSARMPSRGAQDAQPYTSSQGRIAANPVRVFQHISVGARPLCRLGKVVPILRRFNRAGVMYISCSCVPVPK